MKASPNREQFLFLVTGGIILVLILLVVIFNMVRTPGDLIAEQENQPAPKVKVGDRTTDSSKSAWLTQVAPAPIFNPDAKPDGQTTPKVEIDAKDLTAAPDSGSRDAASRTQEAWNPKEASTLESARLTSRPLAKDAGLNPARNQPADNHAGPPPMPKMSGDASGSRAAPPLPSSQETGKLAKNQIDATNNSDNDDDEASDKPTQKPEGYSVQVASFNDNEHAAALTTKLSNLMFEGKRMPVYQHNQKINGKKMVYRVRLGPFATQARAQQAAQLAHNKAGLKGTVLGPNQ